MWPSALLLGSTGPGARGGGVTSLRSGVPEEGLPRSEVGDQLGRRLTRAATPGFCSPLWHRTDESYAASYAASCGGRASAQGGPEVQEPVWILVSTLALQRKQLRS